MMSVQNDEGVDSEKIGLLKKISQVFKNDMVRFIVGLFLVMFAVYLFIPYFSYFFTGAADQSVMESAEDLDLIETAEQVQNVGGAQGAQLTHYLVNSCFGFAAIFVIVFIGAVGIRLMKVYKLRVWRWFIGCSMLLIWSSLTLGYLFYDFYKDSFVYWGGLHGYNVSNWLESQIGTAGVLIFLLVFAMYILIFLNQKFIERIRNVFNGFYFSKLKFKKIAKESGLAHDDNISEENAEGTVTENETDEFKQESSHSKPAEVDVEPVIPVVVQEDSSPEEDSNNEDSNEIETPKLTITPPVEEAGKEPDSPIFEVEAVKDEIYKGSLEQPYNPKLDLERYKFPTLDLMKHYENSGPTINMEEQNMNKNKIISTLRSFGIEIGTIKATVGPAVTLYEITTEQGVRIAKIRGLEDDIALSLAALGIRIIAPIPGKGTIGIEVPNADPKIVSGQSIIGSKKFQTCNYELPVAFGKTITNEVFIVDLAKMPHILVAGATGQGKSVGLNTMITSLLYKKHPAELKFVLIDPKKVEFSIYSAIKYHYLAQLPDAEDAIITDVTKVVQTLNSICVEMDGRYDLLKTAKVRNIKEYNNKFINRKLNPEKGHKYMPYMVVIIDEFGDLIMTAGKEIELPIARIAQLARAVGIHMVIATQRPTTNIITGTIKANFPARVAFRVSAMMDSRTILDRPGANQLIGKGDMLFLQGADPVRVQCAFIDTPEVEEITKHISMQQGYSTPFYLPEFTSEEGRAAMGEVDPARLDPLFEEAARMIVLNQQGSTSLIQRKFSIGYNRAGRIMDQLEKLGIVGPSEGSKARQVYCTDEADLQQRLNN